MNSTRIEVPLALPAPHFDDERTIATARQVKPIGRAKVTESWRKLRTLLPLILLATVCGALGAAGVNYYEERHKVDADAPLPTNNMAVTSQAEAAPVAVAASATPSPVITDKGGEAASPETNAEVAPTEDAQTKSVTQPARDEAKPDPTPEKKSTEPDATKLTRKRRVNPADDDALRSNKKGAGRITDIFSGPNPF